jgi:hypothetical protein
MYESEFIARAGAEGCARWGRPTRAGPLGTGQVNSPACARAQSALGFRAHRNRCSTNVPRPHVLPTHYRQTIPLCFCARVGSALDAPAERGGPGWHAALLRDPEHAPRDRAEDPSGSLRVGVHRRDRRHAAGVPCAPCFHFLRRRRHASVLSRRGCSTCTGSWSNLIGSGWWLHDPVAVERAPRSAMQNSRTPKLQPGPTAARLFTVCSDLTVRSWHMASRHKRSSRLSPGCSNQQASRAFQF